MLFKFLHQFKFRQIFTLFLEEYFGLLIRFIPGYEGMWLRWLFYKFTFRKLGKSSLIWTNVFFTHSYNIKAGNYLAINYGTHIDGRGGLTIGDYVLIGPNVFIGTSNHHIYSVDNQPRLLLGHIKRPTQIGSNVWIGANVVICPGVKIGNNSVVGAGSVVTKDVDEGVIVAGNPAIIKKSLKKTS